MTDPILSVEGVTKTYKGGVTALQPVDLSIRRGEIFALLGPNGAGKTTLISIVCGIVTPSAGAIRVDGHDALRDYKGARRKIGLVPQELSVDMFERVIDTVNFSRGLFGRAPNPAYIEQVLRDLSLWDKRHAKLMELSGGMKRRVLIAKGQLLLVEEKAEMMKKLGKREMLLTLAEPMATIPSELAEWHLALEDEGKRLRYIFDARAERTGIPSLLRTLGDLGIGFNDLETYKSSLEDIFVDLVEGTRA